MKTIIFSALVFFANISQAQPSQRIEVGCFTGNNGSFAFSSAMVDRMVKYYIPNALQVENSELIKLNSGSYYIKSDVFYAQGWGTSVVMLEREGNKLFIGSSSCTHQCIPVAFKSCVYKSDVTGFEPCVAVTCSCADEGETSAKVETGDMRSLNRMSLFMKDLKSLCD